MWSQAGKSAAVFAVVYQLYLAESLDFSVGTWINYYHIFNPCPWLQEVWENVDL